MMRKRDRIGLNIAPLFLRVMLAVVFIWAGLGKVSATMPVSGEDAAILAKLGVVSPAPTTAAKPEQAGGSPETATAASAAGTPVSVLRLYGLAVMIHRASHPEASAGGGAAPAPIWPLALGEGQWPVYLAWAVALSELIGGIAILLGLFTRLMALVVSGVMLGAMWLTQFGPAIQSGQATLGFLPSLPAFDPGWQTLMFQFALLAAAMALAFCGPGRLSLDSAILGGARDGNDDDDE